MHRPCLGSDTFGGRGEGGSLYLLEGSHFLPISLPPPPPRLFSTPEDVGKAEGPEVELETSEDLAAVRQQILSIAVLTGTQSL